MNRRWATAVAVLVAVCMVAAVALFVVVRIGGFGGFGDGATPQAQCPVDAAADTADPSGQPQEGQDGQGGQAAESDAEVGAIVATEPLDAPRGAQAWKITYCSTGRDATLVDVTGVLVVPDRDPPAGGYPLIAYAHGTAGLGDQCAPSDKGVDRIPYVQEWLDSGYAVVATDYAGLGTEGTPGYLIGESEARSVLDSIRAAQNMPETSIASRTAIVGYSQGGHAALFAGESAAEYASELELVAVAALAPPTNVEKLIEKLFSQSSGFGLAIDVIASWADYYDLDTSQLLTRRGAGAVEDARSQCAGDAPRGGADAFVRTPLEQLPEWVEVLDDNNTGQRPIDVPVFIAQAGDDVLVPAMITRSALPAMCQVGTDLNFVQYPGTSHIDLPGEARSDVIAFVQDAFAGESVDIGRDCADLQ